MEVENCTQCGSEISGNFCGQCGTKKMSGDWQRTADFGELLSHPIVQKNIQHYLAQAKHSQSAAEFLGKVDTFMPPGMSLNKLTEVVLPIYTQLGIKTGKSKSSNFSGSIQEVFVKTLCSLAKNNYPLNEVKQIENGVVLLAKIPSDMKTFGGDIIISLRTIEDAVQANIDAKISGQLYDWGKSKGIIKNIFGDIETLELDMGS